MRRRRGIGLDRGYTDICVVVGRTLADAERLLDDLLDQRSELLLGYDVRIISPQAFSRLHGLRLHTYVASEYATSHRDWPKVEAVLKFGMLKTAGPSRPGVIVP